MEAASKIKQYRERLIELNSIIWYIYVCVCAFSYVSKLNMYVYNFL